MQKVFSKAYAHAETMGVSKSELWKILSGKYKNRRRQIKNKSKMGKGACVLHACSIYVYQQEHSMAVQNIQLKPCSCLINLLRIMKAAPLASNLALTSLLQVQLVIFKARFWAHGCQVLNTNYCYVDLPQICILLLAALEVEALVEQALAAAKSHENACKTTPAHPGNSRGKGGSSGKGRGPGNKGKGERGMLPSPLTQSKANVWHAC